MGYFVNNLHRYDTRLSSVFLAKDVVRPPEILQAELDLAIAEWKFLANQDAAEFVKVFSKISDDIERFQKRIFPPNSKNLSGSQVEDLNRSLEIMSLVTAYVDLMTFFKGDFFSIFRTIANSARMADFGVGAEFAHQLGYNWCRADLASFQQHCVPIFDSLSHLMAVFITRTEKTAGLLYHYTPFENLGKILKGVRMSRHDNMNDRTEFDHGKRVIKNAISKYPLIKERLETQTKVRAYSFLNIFCEYDFFNFSLSEDGDSSNQWFQYADQGKGICIGFRPQVLQVYDKNCRLGRISYSSEEVNIFIKLIIGAAVLLSHHLLKAPVPHHGFTCFHVALGLAKVLSHFVPFVKHETFKYEKEWRLIYSRERSPANDDRYYWLGAKAESEIRPLPVSSVILGPACNHSESDVKNILRRNNYSGVGVSRSSCPLR